MKLFAAHGSIRCRSSILILVQTKLTVSFSENLVPIDHFFFNRIFKRVFSFNTVWFSWIVVHTIMQYISFFKKNSFYSRKFLPISIAYNISNGISCYWSPANCKILWTSTPFAHSFKTEFHPNCFNQLHRTNYFHKKLYQLFCFNYVRPSYCYLAAPQSILINKIISIRIILTIHYFSITTDIINMWHIQSICDRPDC